MTGNAPDWLEILIPVGVIAALIAAALCRLTKQALTELLLDPDDRCSWSTCYSEFLIAVFGPRIWSWRRWHALLLAFVLSLVLAFIMAPALWPLFLQPPHDDSFFTLTALGQVGLLSLSLLLMLLFHALCVSMMIALARYCGAATTAFARYWRGYNPLGLGMAILGIAITVIFFWLGVTLVPQLYYLYYQTLFAGLPVQWVVGPPASLQAIIALLNFREPAPLSRHLSGLALLSGFLPMVWGPILALACLFAKRFSRRPSWAGFTLIASLLAAFFAVFWVRLSFGLVAP